MTEDFWYWPSENLGHPFIYERKVPFVIFDRNRIGSPLYDRCGDPLLHAVGEYITDNFAITSMDALLIPDCAQYAIYKDALAILFHVPPYRGSSSSISFAVREQFLAFSHPGIDRISANHRLFIATRNPPTFFVFDTNTGKVVARLPCVGVNDDMTFDTKRKRIYITGDGATSVFEQRDADHYEHFVDVPTGFRAKTSLYVPEVNRLYINLSGGDKRDAQVGLQIYQVQP